MWSALRRSSADQHLLSMNKLKVPATKLYLGIKSCIINYLCSIKPIAYTKLIELKNDSCNYRVLQQHVDILRMATRKAFHCLNLYKIAISNVYADAPEVCMRHAKKNSNSIH